MLLRRTLPITLVALSLACEPKVPHCDSPSATDPACKGSFNPGTVDYAAFDIASATPDIPLPNDLVLQPQAIATQTGAQQELLLSFVDQTRGTEIGFPNDQEVPITIDFVRETIDPNTGAATRSAPDLDVTSINKDPAHPNLIVLSLAAGSLGAPAALDPVKATDYVKGPDHGTLTVHKSPDKGTGSRRWAPGQYVAAVRGGPNGVQVTGTATGVNPQPAMYLLLQGKRLTDAENLTLIPGNSAAEKASNAAQLEKLRSGYVLPLVFVNKFFAPQEVAVLSTFLIAPQNAHIEVDPDAGAVPLPSDFFSGADGHLSDRATALFNTQLPGLGTGLRTLDGFSTTAGIISQGTLGTAFQADSINQDSVFLYEINTKVSPPTATRYAEVHELFNGKAPRYAVVPLPVPFTVPPGAPPLSAAIFLQPAVPAPLPSFVGGGYFAIPPLNEGTTYGVVITDKVKDQNGTPLSRSTLSKLLFFKNKLFDAGHSTIPSSLDDATAAGLERLRTGVVPLLSGALQRDAGLSADHIAFVYTFHTQTFSSDANHLAALPYATPTATALPVAGTTSYSCPAGSPNPKCKAGATTGAKGDIAYAGTIQNVFDKYGVDTNGATHTVPSGNIGAIVESTIPLINNLTDPRGVFSDPTKVPPVIEPAPVLIALPQLSNITNCPGGAGVPPCIAPLVVFRHGIFDSRADMLSLADRFTKAGFVIAAIDAAKHGARAFCAIDAECTTGSCVHDPALAGQLDPPGMTPGHCKGATPIDPKLVNTPRLCPSGASSCNTAGTNPGTPVATGNFLLGANLFRTRDSFRQDVIDQAQLIRVLGVDPSGLLKSPPVPVPDSEEIFHAMLDTFGVIIDPSKVYFIGQSLGSISGTVDVATNPRISKAVLNVGGGTVVDVFRTSPSLGDRLNALLSGLGIAQGTSKYLQFINVAKWVLDPADPINFADKVQRNPLPNLLHEASPGSLPPALDVDPMLPKKTLAQVANCDNTVPNPFNYQLDQLIGLGRDSAAANPTGTLQLFHFQALDSAACPGGPIPHGFIVNWGFATPPSPAIPQASFSAGVAQMTQTAQDDAAAFFKDDTHPPADRSPVTAAALR